MPGYDTSEVSKHAFILAAGELFAAQGVSGTSVRAIAAKAGLNVALINYHFGNKDGLVNAVIDFVLENYRHYSPDAFIKEHPELWETVQGQREIVLYMINQAYEFMRPDPEHPWVNTFLMRCAETNEIGHKRILEEILIPGCIRYSKLYARITGSTDYQKARCWALSVFAPPFIYAVNPRIIDDTCPRKHAGDDFYNDLKARCARIALDSLGLGQPRNDSGERD